MTEGSAAARAAAGEAALWWVDLLRGVNEMVKGAATRDTATRLSAREALWGAVVRWGLIAGHPLASALMADHVAGLAFFAAAAAKKDKRDMDAALDFLIANLEDQSRLYAADSTRFPADRWREIFLRHITLTASYTRALLAGDVVAYEADYYKAQRNRDALAAFSKEFFVHAPSTGRESE